MPFKKYPVTCLWACIGLGHALVTFFMFFSPWEDHIVITPDGYYRSGPGVETGTGTIIFTFKK